MNTYMPIFPDMICKVAFADALSPRAVLLLNTTTQERVSGADLQKFQNSEAAFNTRKCRAKGVPAELRNEIRNGKGEGGKW